MTRFMDVWPSIEITIRLWILEYEMTSIIEWRILISGPEVVCTLKPLGDQYMLNDDDGDDQVRGHLTIDPDHHYALNPRIWRDSYHQMSSCDVMSLIRLQMVKFDKDIYIKTTMIVIARLITIWPSIQTTMTLWILEHEVTRKTRSGVVMLWSKFVCS